MSADPITYCLERLSDYREFERLCSALLAGVGYTGIEPLGGTGDKGRDAIIRSDAGGNRTVFAYTVRSDWRGKLNQDATRIRAMGHNPDVLVFVCTEALSATEKDWAHTFVQEKFGWTLDLFDMERLRVQLVGPQRHLLARHPGIFVPPIFPQRGGQSLAESPDTILIDHVDGDHALATWLSRRLTLQGYRTWCRGTAPLTGENPDETIRKLLEVRAAQYLPVLSPASLSDALFLERCTVAAVKSDFVLPCRSGAGLPSTPSRLQLVQHADFSASWQEGLQQVLGKLASLGVEPDLEHDRGRQIALRDYLPTRVTVATPEPVFANVFRLRVPETMFLHELRRSLTQDEVSGLRAKWAFAELGAFQLVSFTPAPKDAILVSKVDSTTEFLWGSSSHKGGKKTEDLAKELARRSLEVVCAMKGLKYCPDRKVFHFEARDGKDWNQPIEHVDGRQTKVQLTGERTKGWGDHASPFLYQLAPLFQPQKDADGSWRAVVNIYVRTTTLEGKVFELKEIGRRRKIVTKSWWNKEWLARLLGVVQALQTTPGCVELGEGRHSLRLDVAPLRWDSPVGLDVLALSGMTDLGEEMANMRSRVHDEEDEESQGPVAAERSA